MPGRLHWLLFCCAALLTSVAAVVVAMLAVPDEPLFVLPLAQVAMLCAGPGLRALRMRRLLTDARFQTVGGNPAVLAALETSGVRDLVVRTGPVGGFGRGFRAGPQVVIFMHDRVRPEPAHFLFAHEAAHLARYDQIRRPALVMTALTCFFCLTVAGWPATIVGAAGVVTALAVFNRRMELDCDRLAVMWAGLEAAEQGFALVARAWDLAPRTPLRDVRRLLTYPPPDRRRAFARKAVRAYAPETR